MSQPVNFELRVSQGVDPAIVVECFRAELSKRMPEAKVDEVKIVRPLGMSEADIIISFAISAAASILVHVYRNEVDACARAVADTLKSGVMVIYETARDSIAPKSAAAERINQTESEPLSDEC